MVTLNLEVYARILAHLACRRGARLEEILSALDVDVAALRATEPMLREELSVAWTQRRGIDAMKFAAAFGAELQRLGPIGGDGASPPPPEPVPVVTDVHDVPETAVPSYLQESPAGRWGAVVAPPALALPTGLPSSEPPSMPPTVSRKELAGTANVDLSAVVAAIKQGALPFSPGHPDAPAPPDAQEPRPPTERRAPPVGSGTIEADLSAVIASAYAGPAFVRPAAPAPAPPPGPDDPDLTQLPLETYASVSAALARGEPREVALARYGLTAESFGRLAQAWGQRFQREPQLLARFKELARSGASAGRNDEGR